MKPPDDAVETTQGTIWLEDGILIERMKDVLSTVETVSETFDVFLELGGGLRRPFLFDVRNWQGATPGAWSLAVEKTESTFVAVALLVDAESKVNVGPMPEAVDRLMIPARYFTDEDEALVFLRRFRDPPNLGA
jgi:hypothetical protein